MMNDATPHPPRRATLASGRIAEGRPAPPTGAATHAPSRRRRPDGGRPERRVAVAIALLLVLQLSLGWHAQRQTREAPTRFGNLLRAATLSPPAARPAPRLVALETPDGRAAEDGSRDDDGSAGDYSVLYRRAFDLDSVPRDAPRATAAWYAPSAADFSDGDDPDVCEPMHAYQLASFPTCNAFHELNLESLRYVNSGGSRSAFALREVVDGRTVRFVYKSVRYGKEITAKLVEEQRKDGLILERATASRFIPDLHGYCGVVSPSNAKSPPLLPLWRCGGADKPRLAARILPR